MVLGEAFPTLDDSLVADVLCGCCSVCSLRFPRCARREMCVLCDGETIECGLLMVRSDCENKSSGTERVSSLGSGVPSEAISFERTRTFQWKQSGVRREPTSVQNSSTYFSRGHRIKQNTQKKDDHDACRMQFEAQRARKHVHLSPKRP